jgi:Co/Zn/Cd efflux system component
MTFLSAVLIASLAWWIATGLVLGLARAGSRRFKTVMALASGVALLGLCGMIATADSHHRGVGLSRLLFGAGAVGLA